MTEGRRPTSTDWKIVAALLVVSLAARLACIHLNAAEYTDGILQITAFEYGFTFWPPLYTVLVKVLFPAVGDLELAGKIVAVFSSSLVVVPLYMVALGFGGRRAAVYATLLYLANAIAGRWGIRVMSDSLFTLLFFWSAALFFMTVLDAGEGGRGANRRRLIGGSVLAPLSMLVRYQGMFLLPLQLIAISMSRRKGEADGNARVSPAWWLLLLWAAPGAWLIAHFGGHGRQIGERAGLSVWAALRNYWSLAESFVLLFPYFITIPVFVVCSAGLVAFLRGDGGQRMFGWAFVVLAGLIIGMQSVFSSFQSRYLLPLIPFMTVMAGVAAGRWEELAARRRIWVRSALILILVYSFGWTVAVVVLQRGAFGDIKQAAGYCSTLPNEARIVSTETYKPHMPSVKMSYWSGREVGGVDPATGRAVDGSGRPLLLREGDYICLHSAYGGLSTAPLLVAPLLEARLDRQIESLRRFYDLEQVRVFADELVPLLPDIMENPDTHQNPAAWFFRYTPQRFRTIVFRVTAVREGR